MEKKSLHGLAKGTSLEKIIAMQALGEAKGTMMYYALARLAREQGMADVAEKFIEAAEQEANHAGFYAVLNGMYPKDFWGLVNGLQKAEAAAVATLKKEAGQLREAGLDEAAAEVEIFAEQEGHHGVLLQELLDKYGKNVDTTGKKVYVCGCCGYEYVGDLDAEGEDYVCPVCGMPKKVFKNKA
ncbi:MAG: rubrerythrin [Lentisphaeria bacterium]|nr:rubrerythrin [Lentisphaeria bacterium]